MTNLYPIKAGFRGGFLSLAARGRVDTSEYATGLSECKNFVVTPQSSLQYRLGSRIVTDEIPTAVDGRLITFPASTSESKVLVMDGTNISIYDQLGIVIGTGVLNKDPVFDKKPSGWKNKGSGYAAAWVADAGKRFRLQVHSTLGGTGLNSISIWQKVSLPAGSFTLRFGYASETRTQGVDQLFAVPLQVKIGTTNGGTQIFNNQYVGGKWDTPTFFEENFVLAAPTTIFLEARLVPTLTAGVNQGAIYAPFSITDGSTSEVVFPSPWDATQLATVQIAKDAGTNEMYFAHPEVAPQVLHYEPLTRAWTFGEVTFTGKPTEWVTDNYPSVCTIFQSRLWMGSTPNQPNSVWASKTGNYKNFTVGANAADGMAFTVSTTGTFKWFLGRDFMLIGTDEGEWQLSAQQQVITVNDFHFVQQTGYSACGVQPIFLGQQICYVGSNRTRIRVTNSSYEAQGWIGMDISLVSDELLESGVKELNYAGDPNYLLYSVNADGTMALCCYDKNNQLLSWSKFELANNGRVLSCAVTSESSGSNVWLLVERGGVTTLEIAETSRSVSFHLDSFTIQPIYVENQRAGAFSVDYSSAFDGGALYPNSVYTIRTGLEYYEGQEVGVVFIDTNNAIGATVKKFLGVFTVLNGTIVLPQYATGGQCAVGFIYEGIATTLPLEGGNKAGTAQGSKRKWNRIFARLARSVIPFLNGYRPVLDNQDIVDQNFPYGTLVSGDYEVRNEGYDEGVVTISNSIPLDCEVAALFGKSQSNET